MVAVMTGPLTPAELAEIATLLASMTSLGAVASNMELRCAVEFLAGRGFLVRPPAGHVAARRPDPATRSIP
jgi:hypothetical protein